MAGFASTTAEEGAGTGDPQNGTIRLPQQKQQSAKNADGTPARITDKQASRIWGIAHGANKSKEEVIALLKHFGFEQAADVTVDKYDAICGELQKGDQQ
jgi:hypothetical protein